MIAGIGVDVVGIERMRRALTRTPRLRERLFTPQERADAERKGSPVASLAARFAAKEACRKALGRAVPWRDVEVVLEASGAPSLRVAGWSQTFHVSLSHAEGVAIAVVVAEVG